jgi:predicted kinase
MNELAFLVMDLTDRGRADFATRFLNAYLEAGGSPGDYGGLAVLRFYRVYRALVRAKVHALRAAQDGIADAERARLMAASRGYVELAQRCAHDARPAMIVMHGLSGSGKSVLAQALAESMGAIRLRSDVERKRISGLAPLARSGSALAAGLYTSDLTAATYHRLLDLARMGVNAGYAVIVDATFLKRWQRDLFRREANARGVPFVIVNTTAPEHTLHARVTARLADASEADSTVLTHQLTQTEALTDEESSAVLRIDTARGDAEAIQRDASAALCSRLAGPTRSG